MPVSKRTRYEVLKRDNFTCRYCRSTEEALKVDHVIPVALGGSDKPENLVAACQDCNAGKSSTSPSEEAVADVKASDLRWADAIRRVAEARGRQQKKRDNYVNGFDNAWRCWTTGFEKLPIPRPSGWRVSIERFYDLSVPPDELTRLVEVAMANNRLAAEETFRYFAGCVWRYIDEVHEEARQLLAGDA